MVPDSSADTMRGRVSLPNPASGVSVTGQTGNHHQEKDTQQEVQNQFPELDHL
jgi:hypothetical protein